MGNGRDREGERQRMRQDRTRMRECGCFGRSAVKTNVRIFMFYTRTADKRCLVFKQREENAAANGQNSESMGRDGKRGLRGYTFDYYWFF